YDPWAKPEEVMHEYGVPILSEFPERHGYAAIILAVAHKEFLALNLSTLKSTGTLIYDVKAILPETLVDSRL
ncbi:MAG: nucleotide sugar dehydrogenase, partial [Porphyromonadaceae bacterium]|nr:nucleotide sugar dehydrogenase [Porphyromonadaceae bacterium]